MTRSFTFLIFAFVTACTPSPESVCAHLQSLDDKEPNAQRPFAGVQSKKTDSCIKQLNQLKRVDEHEYGSCAKCILKTEHWNDAWDCWVLDHLSDKQTEENAKRIQCSSACRSTLETCTDACQPMTDACSAKCQDALQPCVTQCEFN